MNGVRFDEKHSISDWDLLMVSKTIGDPEVATNYIDIPGRDGTLDLSEFFGGVKYKNRSFSFSFDIFQNPEEWWDLKSKISNYLLGIKRKYTLDVDPNYYYEGRCESISFSNETTVAHINISGQFSPYKLKKEKTIISKSVIANDTITLTNNRMNVMPIVESTSNIVFQFNNKQFSISSNTPFQSPDFILTEGENTVTIISGTGILKFTYREGSL